MYFLEHFRGSRQAGPGLLLTTRCLGPKLHLANRYEFFRNCAELVSGTNPFGQAWGKHRPRSMPKTGHQPNQTLVLNTATMK